SGIKRSVAAMLAALAARSARAATSRPPIAANRQRRVRARSTGHLLGDGHVEGLRSAVVELHLQARTPARNRTRRAREVEAALHAGEDVAADRAGGELAAVASDERELTRLHIGAAAVRAVRAHGVRCRALDGAREVPFR